MKGLYNYTHVPGWSYTTSSGRRVWLFHLDVLAEVLGLKPEVILSCLNDKEEDYVEVPEIVELMNKYIYSFKLKSPIFITDKGLRKLFAQAKKELFNPGFKY